MISAYYHELNWAAIFPRDGRGMIGADSKGRVGLCFLVLECDNFLEDGVGSPPEIPVADTVALLIGSIDARLETLENEIKNLKPHSKDNWDKFEKLSPIIWSAIALFISIFVTGRLENTFKERQLQLENVKDMQELIQKLGPSTPNDAPSYTLSLAAHGRYAVVPLIQALQDGRSEHHPAIMDGLRAAGAVDHDFVCARLVEIIDNRTRLYQAEVHVAAAQLLGDLNCQGAARALHKYILRLQQANPGTAPFSAVPGSQGVSAQDIEDAKNVAERSAEALREQRE